MGLTVLDAGVLIAFLNPADAHHAAARDALAAARDRGDVLALPASALAEVLVGPERHGDETVEEVHQFLDRFPIKVVPLDRRIAGAAARLRAEHPQRLRLPDALVLATAVSLDADILVTTDRGWPRAAMAGLRGRVVQL